MHISERILRLLHGSTEELSVVLVEQALNHLMNAVAHQALAFPAGSFRASGLSFVLSLAAAAAAYLSPLDAVCESVDDLVGQRLSVDRRAGLLVGRLGHTQRLGLLAGRLKNIVDDLGGHRRSHLMNEPTVDLAARLGQVEFANESRSARVQLVGHRRDSRVGFAACGLSRIQAEHDERDASHADESNHSSG